MRCLHLISVTKNALQNKFTKQSRGIFCKLVYRRKRIKKSYTFYWEYTCVANCPKLGQCSGIFCESRFFSQCKVFYLIKKIATRKRYKSSFSYVEEVFGTKADVFELMKFVYEVDFKVEGLQKIRNIRFPYAFCLPIGLPKYYFFINFKHSFLNPFHLQSKEINIKVLKCRDY